MKKKTLCVFLLAFIMTIFSATVVCAEYHHVDGCLVCHNMFGESSNLFLIWEVIETPNSGDKAVIFTCDFSIKDSCNENGTNSYADGDATYDGVCEVCHTATNHHRNDGDNPDPDPHYAGTDCIDCHAHKNEFAHGGGAGGGCEACHGHDAGYEYQPGKFSEGAGTVKSHSTHTEDDSDDLKGPFVSCDSCHDTANYPFFKSGTGNAPYDLSETDVCDACHSPGGSYNGVNSVSGSVGAKDNWINGVYNGDALATGKGKWCAGCHDAVPANSKVDGTGVPAPNIAGKNVTGNWQSPVSIVATQTTIVNADNLIDNNLSTGTNAGQVVFDLGASVAVSHIRLFTVANSTVKWKVYGSNNLVNWTRILYGQSIIWGAPVWYSGEQEGWDESRLDRFIPVRYIKLYKQSPWPAGGQREFEYKTDLQYGYYINGHKISCSDCHKTSSIHLDGISQTYRASLNNYQTGYRLNSVDVDGEMVQPLEIPRVGWNWGEYPRTDNDFALCFDCHDKSKLLGDASSSGDFYQFPLQTNFWDDANLDGNGNVINDHIRHLRGRGGGGNSPDWDSDWDGTGDSPQSCTACHNVHGSPAPAMTRHGELVSTPGTTDKAPLFNLRYVNKDGKLDHDLSNVSESIGAQTQFYGAGPGTIAKNGMCYMCHCDGFTYHRGPA